MRTTYYCVIFDNKALHAHAQIKRVVAIAMEVPPEAEAEANAPARRSVTSLEDASFFFIVENVHTYSPASLSLLPLRVRRQMLPFLPPAQLWRLERCRGFAEGIDMEGAWKERVRTHISAWIYPEDVDEVKHEDHEGRTSGEVYFDHVTHVLLSMSPDLLQHLNSQTHLSFNDISERTTYLRQKGRFQLSHAKPSSGDTMVKKEDYVDLLFYGVHMKTVPPLYKVVPCPFDPNKEYSIPLHYNTKGPKHPGCSHGTDGRYSIPSLCVQCFQSLVGYLVDNSDRRPKRLCIVTPSRGLIESVTNDKLLQFLHSVEEVKVVISQGACSNGVLSLVDVEGLSPTSFSIKEKCLHATTISGSSYWGRLLSVTGSMLRTKPGLKLVEIVSCSLEMMENTESVVTTFLHTATSCTRTLNIRQTACSLQYSSRYEHHLFSSPSLAPQVRGPQQPLRVSRCQNGENKILRLPFLPNGPCSLPWLLAFPDFSLKHLELTVPETLCDKHLPEICRIMSSWDSLSSPVPAVESTTVTVECKESSVAEAQYAGLIFDLAMCPHIDEVRIMKV